MNKENLKDVEEEKYAETHDAEHKSRFSMNFDIDERTRPLVKVEDNNAEEESIVNAATQKYGISIDNKKNGQYKEIYNIKISGLDEKEKEEINQRAKSIKDDLFTNSKDDFDFTSRLTKLNMNLSSQIGDNYNNLNRELAKSMKVNSSDGIIMEINNLNNVIKGYDMKSTTSIGNPVDMFLNIFKKNKRKKEIDTESIEDKINVILDELASKRDEQIVLLDQNDKKVFDMLSFTKEINKTILICKELLFSVEKKRIESADQAINEGDSSPMLISHYKEIYSQEKSLENLIRNLLVVRLHLNTSFNKNLDIRSTYNSVFSTINDVITFVVPSYRSLLIDYITENKLEDTLILVNSVKKARDKIESESHKNYQSIRVAANDLANESIFNIKTLEQSISIIIDTEKMIREADEKAKVIREDDIRNINELTKKLEEYTLGKNRVKK